MQPETAFAWYQYISHLRPGAFMGWKVDALYKTYTRPSPGTTDVRTGIPHCPFKAYPSICNWHRQFMFDWVFGNETLLGAVDYANRMAMSPSSSPPIDNSIQTKIPNRDGTAPLGAFDPRTCLRIYGYGDLKFNAYNYEGQWPPP
jgi:hypothetical protein